MILPRLPLVSFYPTLFVAILHTSVMPPKTKNFFLSHRSITNYTTLPNVGFSSFYDLLIVSQNSAATCSRNRPPDAAVLHANVFKGAIITTTSTCSSVCTTLADHASVALIRVCFAPTLCHVSLTSSEHFFPNGGKQVSHPHRLFVNKFARVCLLYTSPSPRDRQKSRMPSSA